MCLPEIIAELSRFYGQPDSHFLKLPFRQFFRKYNEMEKLKAREELSVMRATQAAHGDSKDYYEDLLARAYGRQRIDESKSKNQNDKAIEMAFMNWINS